jgi:hypothetical protein
MSKSKGLFTRTGTGDPNRPDPKWQIQVIIRHTEKGVQTKGMRISSFCLADATVEEVKMAICRALFGE